MTPTVFISYNHKDKAVAEQISSKLKAAGLNVLRDAEAMKAGEDIETFILNCLREADVTLSLISINSLLSAWVAMESVYGRYGAEVGNKAFIPAYIDASFFGRSFVDDALDKIEAEVADIDQTMQKRIKRGRGTQDLEAERKRYRDLEHHIDGIVAKLKGCLCIDLQEGNFEAGMQKIIQDLKDLPVEEIKAAKQKAESGESGEAITQNNMEIKGDGNTGIQGVSGSQINVSK